MASADGTLTSVTIHILGTNDAAVLSADTRNLTETDLAGDISTSGTLTISDIDSPATFVAQAATAGSYGTFAVDTGGAWTYTASSAHNEFVAGTTYSDTFSVASADGTLTSVTIHILGTNDAAVLSADTRNLTETDLAGDISTSGTLTISDIDSPATFVAQAATAGSYGTFAVDTGGAWTYTASSAHNEFVAGTTYSDTFSVASADGTLTSVTIHILGTNDAAVLSAITQPGSVAELANASAQNLAPISGTLPVSDLDAGDTFTALISGTPTLVWSGGTLTGAQITALTAAMVTGKLTFTAGVLSNGGTQTIGYTYDASAVNLDFLRIGQTLTAGYSVQVSDGTATSGAQSLSFVVTGTNDAPVLSAITQPGSVAELANASAQNLAPISGTLPVSDLDVGDTFTASISGTPTLAWSGGALTASQITALTAAMVTGKLSFTAGVSSNGGAQTIGYTYDASAANLDFLAAGQTLTVTYAVQVSDGTATSGTQSLSFVVTGTNDAPVLSTTAPTSVNVSGGVQVSSFLNSTDLDTSALSGIAITGTTTNGGGTWQYSTDGMTWTNFGAVSGSSSLLLTSSTRVRITGSGNSGTLTYRAWDQTSGTASVNGTPHSADTTTNGGTTAFSTASVTWSVSHPAGIAGSPINLALTDPSTGPSDSITVTVSGVPSDWSLNAGTNNGDGSWTVQTSDPSALTVTTPAIFAGAMVLNVSESWTNPDGSMGGASIQDNVEAYSASPIFAVSADDTLTGSGGNDEFVFAQPIGNDRVYDFNPTDDMLDLIGFGIAGFADLQAGIANDAGGNAVVTLGGGETITLVGVDAGVLSANNFVFDEEPVSTNAGTMSVGDGAILPIGGTIDNTGTIALVSTGEETDLEILVRGATLQGGGTLILSDNGANVVFGGNASAILTNVDNTILGAGQLGGGQLTLVNESTILANGSNALVIDTGTNAVGNSGTLEATGTGGLMIKSNVDNTGTLWANGGNLTVEGTVSGNGSAEIDGTSRLEFGAASTANTAFGTGDGTLKLAQSAGFTGTIAGFGAGDAIDLADLGFGGSTTLAYAANQDGSGGTLSVSDGTHYASLALLGQYAATGFQAASDPGAGTLITYTPPDANDPNLLTNPL